MGTNSFGTGLLEMSRTGNRMVPLRSILIYLEVKDLVVFRMNLQSVYVAVLRSLF